MIVLNPQINLKKIYILIILSPLIHEHLIFLSLLKFSSMLTEMVLVFNTKEAASKGNPLQRDCGFYLTPNLCCQPVSRPSVAKISNCVKHFSVTFRFCVSETKFKK